MQFSPTLLEQAQKQAGSLQTEWEQGRMEADGIGYYYRTQRIDNNRVVISLINESYAVNIENQLLRGIANTCAIVVSIAFVLILLWALSIIAPLQQIRVYIDKVRKGEEAQLHIDRGDEIGEMANEIVSLREKLKHQEDTKEEMIHNISHDLKTPIATIKSYAQSIKDGIYPYDTLEKSVDVIIDNADRLEKKVYSLLFLNRLDYMMDQARETDKTTDMAATIDTVVRSLKAIRPQIELVRDLQPAVFRGDEESWRIVVENLLENALRYAEKQIVITLREGELSVWNDGPALSQERMERLFKPFEKGTKGKFGLGLSICYKVCQAYGYNIDAENLEKGVIFRITVKEEAPRKEKKKGGKR
jgi:two-component system sensor histidine kinase CssS